MTRTLLSYGSNGSQLQAEHGSLVDAATGSTTITSATVSVKLQSCSIVLKAGTSFYDSSNKLVTSDNLLPATTTNNININLGSNAEMTLKVLTPATVALQYGGTTVLKATAALTGVGWTGDMSGSMTFGTNRRPYSAPVAPNVTIDAGFMRCTGHQLNTGADKYWAKLDWALETDGVGAWVLDDGPGTGTQVAWSSSGNDKRYRAYAHARNQDATGPFGYSDYWYTKPAACTGLTASRTPGNLGQVQLAWINNAKYPGTVEVRCSVDGAAETVVATLDGADTGTVVALDVASTATYTVYMKTPAGASAPVLSGVSNTASVPIGTSTPKTATSATLTAVGATGASLNFSGVSGSPSNVDYWETFAYSTRQNGGAWSAASAELALSAAPVVLSDLALNSSHQARVRGKNPVGEGAWTETGLRYTQPAAPATSSFVRGIPNATIQLSAGGLGPTTTNVLVERSLDEETYTRIGNHLPGESLVIAHDHSLPATFRFVAQTPAPFLESAPGAALYVPGLELTDKTKLPGVARMYTGGDRVRRAFAGTTKIWMDGDF